MRVTVETPAVDRKNYGILVRGAPAVGPNGSGAKPLAFAMAIFLSAFLLFQVQLLLGKEVLPFFGGAAAVWTVCVLVFQLLFLAAYGYSHGLATRLPLRTQVIVHGSLLGASAVLLPILGYIRSPPLGPPACSPPQPAAHPTLRTAEFRIYAIGL